MGRLIAASALFVSGLLAAGVLSTAVPAAPQDCLPVVGCVTVTTPTVPLPTVPLPTLPTSTTSTTPQTPATTMPPPAETRTPESAPESAFAARASVRVLGRGPTRVVEIRVDLSKPARVSALLVRSSRALARRQFSSQAGGSVLRVPIARGTSAGAATLRLTYRSAQDETVRASYRLRLPR